MTVRELLERIDSRELAEWQAYYGIEPWGEERADQRTAEITVRLANYLRGEKQEPFDLYDFMPYTERPDDERPAQPVDEQVAIVKALASNRPAQTEDNGR